MELVQRRTTQTYNIERQVEQARAEAAKRELEAHQQEMKKLSSAIINLEEQKIYADLELQRAQVKLDQETLRLKDIESKLEKSQRESDKLGKLREENLQETRRLLQEQNRIETEHFQVLQEKQALEKDLLTAKQGSDTDRIKELESQIKDKQGIIDASSSKLKEASNKLNAKIIEGTKHDISQEAKAKDIAETKESLIKQEKRVKSCKSTAHYKELEVKKLDMKLEELVGQRHKLSMTPLSAKHAFDLDNTNERTQQPSQRKNVSSGNRASDASKRLADNIRSNSTVVNGPGSGGVQEVVTHTKAISSERQRSNIQSQGKLSR